MRTKIFVAVKLKSKQEKVIQLDQTHFEVFIKETPIEGKANQAIIKSMADYLKIAPSRIRITQGLTAKQKVVEVDMLE